MEKNTFMENIPSSLIDKPPSATAPATPPTSAPAEGGPPTGDAPRGIDN